MVGVVGSNPIAPTKLLVVQTKKKPFKFNDLEGFFLFSSDSVGLYWGSASCELQMSWH